MNKSYIKKQIEYYLNEDDLYKNQQYLESLPKDEVDCSLKIKDDVLLSGIPFFESVFELLSGNDHLNLSEFEGTQMKAGDEINFKLPFHIALSGERIALNLLQHATSISTFTKKYVDIASTSKIKILDTRKTTPGLRTLEKYATNIGGAFNHRLSQMDAFMIKDNHKNHFGGLKGALNFFKELKSFYTPIIVEIHDLNELHLANEFKVQHLMLDNFKPEEIKEAIGYKQNFQTYEVSGGITLETLNNYLIDGVDAISVGAITYNASHVDISLKYGK